MAHSKMLRIEELIKFLLDKNALLFGDFTLKSGRKSPFYFNMAKAIRTGCGFSMISTTLAGYIYANFLEDSVPPDRKVSPDSLFIFGPAYKGIPLAAGVAYALNDKFGADVRWGFNRKEVKTHGDKDDAYLIGEIKENDCIIIIDDVITTGSTKIEAMEHIKSLTIAKNLNFLAVVGLIDRFEGGADLREKVNVFGVIRIDHLVDLCHDKDWITEENYVNFKKYFEKYGLNP
ncbi:MAG: orotate phosphoribosyltransferase [Promethearchaeota archaeon]